MKKFLFPAVALMLAAGAAAAAGQNDAGLRLENEAAEFEKKLNPVFKDERSAADWKAMRKAALRERYKNYREAAQKSGGRRMIAATNPPECTYYSTEGVCSLPGTVIAPYPRIAHVNTRLDFRFPRELGNFTADRINVYPLKNLGYSIKYFDRADKAVADIYIYDLPASPEGEEAALVRALRSVAAEIGASPAYRNVRIDERFRRGSFGFGGKNAFLCFFAEFDSRGFNDRNELEKCQSFTLLFAKERKIVKIRITRGGGDRKAFIGFVNGFLGAFDRAVMLDSQTRTRKFEKAETPPVVVPGR